MEIKDIDNYIFVTNIRDNIKYWANKDEKYKKFFLQEEMLVFLSIIESIFRDKKLDYRLIIDFIDGIVIYLMSISENDPTKKKEYTELAEEVTKPVSDILKSYLSTEFTDYRIENHVTSHKLNLSNGLEIPLSFDEFKKYIKEKNHIPLLDKDMISIENDMIIDLKEKYELQQSKIENLTIEQKQQEKNIDEKLKDYFIPAFYNGSNICKVDYYTENLLPDLQKKFNGKEFAALAYLIYGSNQVRKIVKNMSFAKWRKIFFKCIGRNDTNYKPNDLIDTANNMRNTFYYIN